MRTHVKNYLEDHQDLHDKTKVKKEDIDAAIADLKDKWPIEKTNNTKQLFNWPTQTLRPRRRHVPNHVPRLAPAVLLQFLMVKEMSENMTKPMLSRLQNRARRLEARRLQARTPWATRLQASDDALSSKTTRKMMTKRKKRRKMITTYTSLNPPVPPVIVVLIPTVALVVGLSPTIPPLLLLRALLAQGLSQLCKKEGEDDEGAGEED